MTRHSPGPWQRAASPTQIADARGALVATVHALPHRPGAELAANLCLLQAAPALLTAMLDALQTLHSALVLAHHLDDRERLQGCCTHLQAALAQAVPALPPPTPLDRAAAEEGEQVEVDRQGSSVYP